MNIHAYNSSQFKADNTGMEASMSTFSRKSLASRAKKSGRATAEQLEDAEAPMSAILREEDTKRRE